MVFHSGDLPVAGGVDGKDGGGVVALQGFRRGETESSVGLVPLTQGVSLCLGGHLGRQKLCPLPRWQGVKVAGAWCCSCCLASLPGRLWSSSAYFELVSHIRNFALSI